MFNQTIARFGHPATLVREYEHWLVLLRPSQVTAGSLILSAKSDATAYGALPVAAFTEQALAIAEIEATLRRAVDCERINYLMLMMVDPHVHFHVIPRYAGERTAAGFTIADAGWPKTPDLGAALALDAGGITALATWLKGFWSTR